MSCMVKVFVHAICKRLKKCLAQKVAHFGSLNEFIHHWIALELLYNMGLEWSFLLERFPSYTLVKIDENSTHDKYWSVRTNTIAMVQHFLQLLGHKGLNLGINQKLSWCLHNQLACLSASVESMWTRHHGAPLPQCYPTGVYMKGERRDRERERNTT